MCCINLPEDHSLLQSKQKQKMTWPDYCFSEDLINYCFIILFGKILGLQELISDPIQMQLHIFLGLIVHCKAMLKSQEKLSANESAKNCRILPDRKNCNPFPKIQTFCLNSKCKHCLVLYFF